MYTRIVSKRAAVAQQTPPFLLTLLTPWGKVGLTLPLVVIPDPGDLTVLGQRTVGEVLNIDVMAESRRKVAVVRRRDDDGVVRIIGGGEERLDVEETRE